MHFTRLHDQSHPLHSRAMALYRDSFPIHEQRQPPSQGAALAHEDYWFNLIYDEAEFVGLLLCWKAHSFTYVEHFCIEPALRGRQYGSKALALLAQEGRQVILEIDPVVDEQSLRRKRFYEQAGYVANPYAHVHPPYHAGAAGHPLLVLSDKGPLSALEYSAFAEYLNHVVMAWEAKFLME